ncbi:MAG: archease [Candidatus Woesearchaeota archaeon]
MYSYEFLDHKADIKIQIKASTIEEIFNAIVDVFNKITCEDSEGEEIRFIELNFKTIEDLVFDFVSELIYFLDAELFVAYAIRCDIQKNRASFVLFGKRIKKIKRYVKAITYHDLKCEKKDNIFICEFILDI